MPELPEVETTRRGLIPLITGRTITEINVRQPALRWPVDVALLNAISGEQFTSLERRAKYLLLHTSDPSHSLLVHLGMSGSLRVNSIDEPLRKHDHIIFTLDHTMSLRYHDPRRFGQIKVINRQQWPDYLIKLGPEPLSDAFNGIYLHQRANKRKTAVKSFIMNQHIVVGVGNIYASEALFHSGIHPASIAGNIPLNAYQRLVDEIKAVLQRAIIQGGTTLRDFLHSDGKSGYFQQTLSVYGRAGKKCPQCKQPLESINIAGRSSVFCVHCQKAY